ELRLARPLALAEAGRRLLRVRLGRVEGELAIESRDATDPLAAWDVHARGSVAAAAGEAPTRAVDEIRRRCARWPRLEGPHPHPRLALGPRFGCLRAVGYGDGELLAEGELGEAFAGELTGQPLHPALVEMATGCALSLIPDFNPVRDFLLPSAYGRVRVWDALPARFVCHLRHRRLVDGRGEVFDATFLDAEGRERLAIAGLPLERGPDP